MFGAANPLGAKMPDVPKTLFFVSEGMEAQLSIQYHSIYLYACVNVPEI